MIIRFDLAPDRIPCLVQNQAENGKHDLISVHSTGTKSRYLRVNISLLFIFYIIYIYIYIHINIYIYISTGIYLCIEYNFILHIFSGMARWPSFMKGIYFTNILFYLCPVFNMKIYI